MGRNKKKGYLLKSEFCKKYGISISKFNETLLEKNILVYHLISTCYITGHKKYAIGIGDKGYNKIAPMHGSNQQGTFQYSEKFLKIVFNIQDEQPKNFNLKEYKINFGRYNGRIITTMVSKTEIDYCRWVLDNCFKTLTDEEKLVNEKYLAFKYNIDLHN